MAASGQASATLAHWVPQSTSAWILGPFPPGGTRCYRKRSRAPKGLSNDPGLECQPFPGRSWNLTILADKSTYRLLGDVLLPSAGGRPKALGRGTVRGERARGLAGGALVWVVGRFNLSDLGYQLVKSGVLVLAVRAAERLSRHIFRHAGLNG